MHIDSSNAFVSPKILFSLFIDNANMSNDCVTQSSRTKYSGKPLECCVLAMSIGDIGMQRYSLVNWISLLIFYLIKPANKGYKLEPKPILIGNIA